MFGDQYKFDDVKVGDKIIVTMGFRSKRHVGTVARITKAQFMVNINSDYEYKFWKKNGEQVGGGSSWSRTYCMKATDEELKAISDANRIEAKASRVRKFIESANLSAMGEDSLDKMIEVIETERKRDEERCDAK